MILRIAIGGFLAGLGHIFVELINLQTVSNVDVRVTQCHYCYAALFSCFGSMLAMAAIFRLRYQWAAQWFYLLALCFASTVVTIGVEAIFLDGLVIRYTAQTMHQRQQHHRFALVQVLLLIVASSTCVAIMLYVGISIIRRAQAKSRAKQVSLAAVFFDTQGHVLINMHDGGLPTQEMTASFMEFSIADVFDASSPVFRWMFKASTNWHLIAPMLTRMKIHLASCSDIQHNSSRETFSIYFRELFCCGAQQLAEKMGIPLRHMGVCFDKIAQTGGRKRSSSMDIERTSVNSRTGQVIFLVRHVEERDVERFVANGFRFANPVNVAASICASLCLTKDQVIEHLRIMSHYKPLVPQWRPGLHVGCFGVQASLVGGFKILVPHEDRTCLPVAFVQDHMLREECLAFVRKHYGKSVREVLLHCDSDSAALDMEIKAFRSRLMHALNRLQDLVRDLDFDDAYLLPELIRLETKNRGTTQLLLFKYAIPIHALKLCKQLEFIPFAMFNLFQQVHGPELQTSFMRSLHTEFTPIFDLLSAGTNNLSVRTMESGNRSMTARQVSRMFEGVMVQEAIEMRIDTEEKDEDVSLTATFADDAHGAHRAGLEKQIWVLENYPELPEIKGSPLAAQHRPFGARPAKQQPQVTSAAVAGEVEVLTWAEVALRTRPNMTGLPY
ncbi:hypothetical protein BCR37DRAFT_290168 [Protomyces lactucae-debilis]|uniref:MHYT domain-containing protein n=1 Tax=Protomyces lactucae-debilis TaxID=2754530 RepID=A0A1Y2FI04_PROLT|nr:uncharacterized protein BCR37DRAFT_290168 [Protomyces lactucae-debilis]ORY83014.1 hypothetical protein BCR37DRAFT_290168 [Protomyces lactucae-debilis]